VDEKDLANRIAWMFFQQIGRPTALRELNHFDGFCAVVGEPKASIRCWTFCRTSKLVWKLLLGRACWLALEFSKVCCDGWFFKTPKSVGGRLRGFDDSVRLR
jgi:hypothetical protein